MGSHSSRAAKRRDANCEASALRNQQLCDPLTVAISFMRTPAAFRRACSFTLECWDHARYLEVPVAGSLATVVLTDGEHTTDNTRCFPISIKCLDQFPAPKDFGAKDFDRDCDLKFLNTSSTCTLKAKTRRSRPETNLLPKTLVLRNDMLHSVGEAWLAECTSLEFVSFAHLPKLQTVESLWLRGCTTLKSVEIMGLPELRTVGNCWLSGCSSLENARFENLPKLQCVGDQWLYSCTSLRSVTFVNLPELQTAGTYWLQECRSLRTVAFERLPKLQSVGPHWLLDCHSLKTATFVDLPELHTVGGFWLRDCTSLETVTFERLPKLVSVGTKWLHGCTSLKSATFAGLAELLVKQEGVINLPAGCHVQWTP